MKKLTVSLLSASIFAAVSQVSVAGTDIYFTPLTHSAPTATVVADRDGVKNTHFNEVNHPWRAPAGVSQVNLTSMSEIEADIMQSVVRVDGLGTGASMWDMVAFDHTGKYIFIPHETAMGAGVTRYDIENDKAEVLFSGDAKGVRGVDANWENDWGAFDPATYTPNSTLLLGEEWSGQGRLMEVTNPMADPADIKVRELDVVPNVAHEGLRFNKRGKTLYFVDEYNSGSLYKIVFNKKRNYARGGQVYVLSVDAFKGDSSEYWNAEVNATEARTGRATWIPMTDSNGYKLTDIDPFKNGISSTCDNPDTFGGRCAADELGATPFGRPEDMEVGKLRNRNEVVYFTATSERTVYSVEETGGNSAYVRVFASDESTPKNLGHPATTAVMNSPDNLAQDALGNIYVIEDAPNSSNIGGDIWFVRDTNTDGVAESLDHFLSLSADGAEHTGMIFNPANATQFVVTVQHPDSTNLNIYEQGFGDSLWMFDIAEVYPTRCNEYSVRARGVKNCEYGSDNNFVDKLEEKGRKKYRRDLRKHRKHVKRHSNNH